MSDNQYFRLKVSDLSRHHEDDFTQFCFESGADGVAEDLSFAQNNLVYEPDIIETEVLAANVYFTRAPEGEKLRQILAQIKSQFPESKVEAFTEENKDWLAEWKKGFKPFQFAGQFWIVPSWCEIPAEAGRALLIDPGMAFGTGTHETTKLAAGLLIEDMSRTMPQSVIDVGTGTGVLALVARELGAKRVIGIDNDPEACRTARENMEHNSVTDIEIPDQSLETITEQFDLVIANIIDGVLTLLQNDLKRVLRPGGRMILSGVLLERESVFYENFTRETGLKVLKKVSDGEWSAAILEKA
jgi:ribosomal protein L11 methyltransferase